jgi:hypothetical protein
LGGSGHLLQREVPQQVVDGLIRLLAGESPLWGAGVCQPGYSFVNIKFVKNSDKNRLWHR